MSHTNIITVNSTEINNSGPFRVGSTLTSGTTGQVLKSQGRDKSPIWDTDIDTTYQGSATIDIDTTTDPDTINVIKVPNTLTITDSAGSSVVFDGSSTQSITINDNDNQLNLTGALPMIINNGGGLNREVELQYDTTTLGAGGGALEVLRVPNNLTAGTNISFSSGTTYNGSSAITINATDTDNQLNLTEDNGIQITNTGGLNRTIGAKVDGTTVDFDGDQLSVKKVPNDLTAGTNISFSSGTTYDGSSAITINATDTDTTYQGGTGISIDTTTNPDTINCSNIPNSALANSTISGKSLGTSLANLTFYSSSGAFITSYNGADPPTSVVLDGDTTYQGGNNITIDTTTNPDTINLDDDLTGIDSITFSSTSGTTAITGNNYPSNPTTCTNLDLSSSTNVYPLFVGGSEILKSMSYIDNSAQNFNRIFNTSNKYFFDGSQTSGSDTLEIDFTATSTTGYCEYGFYANTLTGGMIFCVGIAAATGGTSPFSTTLTSSPVSIDAYKIGLFDGTTSTYSLKEILDFTSFENTYITSKFFFNNLSVGTRYRMALYGRCFNSGSIFINSGGKNTTGFASRSFHQPAFMKFYEYDSDIGGARTTGSGGGDGDI